MNNVNNYKQSAGSTIEVELQNFAQQVVEVCDRESEAQLSPQAAYQNIRQLWLELKQTKPEAIAQTVGEKFVTE